MYCESKPVSAPINFSPLIYEAAPLSAYHARTRAHVHAFSSLPRRRYCPTSLAFSPTPRALQISQPSPLTSRTPALERDRGDLFSEYTSRPPAPRMARFLNKYRAPPRAIQLCDLTFMSV